jgi:paraquat-inducible protein A
MEFIMTPVTKVHPPLLSLRNKFALSISILSFFFFFPGIYLSMLTVATSGSINAQVPHLEHSFWGKNQEKGFDNKSIPVKIFNTTRSIVNTINNLWTRGYLFVAAMIFLFSIMVPIIKGALVTYIFFCKKKSRRHNIFEFIKAIGKWSMCDVFIVAIFLSYLSTGASQTQNVKNITILGYSMKVDVMAGMHAQLQIGFWCFLGYCMLSLIALQLYEDF